jgi:hypothetical protein
MKRAMSLNTVRLVVRNLKSLMKLVFAFIATHEVFKITIGLVLELKFPIKLYRMTPGFALSRASLLFFYGIRFLSSKARSICHT